MKRCSNCGAVLKQDDLFCPSCREEVQLVPVYETVESSIKEQQRILEEKEREREAILALEEEERMAAARKRNIIIGAGALVVLCVVGFFGISFLMKTSGKSAFNSNYTKAVEAYNEGSYDKSLELITTALEKDPRNLEGMILLADIYSAQGKTDMAISLYTEVIEDNPQSEAAYKKLITIYEILGQGNNIHALLSRCSEQDILDRFAEYITAAPALSVESGTYDKAQDLEITDANGNLIYYTLDGTDPSSMSLAYSDKIGLTGGTIKVRAVSINNHGVPSDIVEGVYEINADYVDAPIIYPRGNTFTFSDGKTHKFTVIIPKGCKAYYSFDEMPTTLSTAYTGPVDMLDGSHVFYAILVDKKTGMASTPTSISYTLSQSEGQESISIVQDSDGNVNASYSDGTVYDPYDYQTPNYDPGYSGGGNNSYTPPSQQPSTPTNPDPAPAPGPSDGGGSGSGGGNTTPTPPSDGGGSGSGGGSTTPDPGPSDGGGGSTTPDPGPSEGGGEVTPDPGPSDGGGDVAPDPGPSDDAGSGDTGADAAAEASVE